jgi:hypothetical protein
LKILQSQKTNTQRRCEIRAISGGLSLKVSDEFTVPLCVVHHNQLHMAGNEASWWRTQRIAPLEHARTLWLATNGSETSDASTKASPNGDGTSPEPTVKP